MQVLPGFSLPSRSRREHIPALQDGFPLFHDRRSAQESAVRGKGLLLLALLGAGAFSLNHLRVRGFLDAYLPEPASGGGGRPVHGGLRPSACPDCHGEIEDYHRRGPHRSLACEDCHRSGEAHVREGEKAADMPPFQSVTRLCSQCHRELLARRRDAPRLNLEAHVIEVGALFSDRVCFDCHLPHDPRP